MSEGLAEGRLDVSEYPLLQKLDYPAVAVSTDFLEDLKKEIEVYYLGIFHQLFHPFGF